MPKQKNYDKRAVARLFAAQGGLATRSQLIGLGVPPSTIRHRERQGGPWRRVLRGVCASHDQALTGLGSLRAALLYAGPESVVTGLAALRAHRVRAAEQCTARAAAAEQRTAQPSPATAPSATTAPSVTASSAGFPRTVACGESCDCEGAATGRPGARLARASPFEDRAAGDGSAPDSPATVKVLIASNRRRSSAAFVLVSRTRRLPAPVEIEGCRVAPVARAAVDACLDTKDTELIRQIVTELTGTGRCTATELRAELDANQTRRSARLRAVLVEFADGIRTGAEAQCRRRLARVAAPLPVWNGRIIEQSTGRVALLPGAVWPEHGIALDLDPAPTGHEPAAARRRWLSGALRMTVAHASPAEVRDRWDEVWAELRGLLNRPPTYRLPPGYVFA
ncbi:MAG TPA: hypothetical protein VH372_07240 [Actinospica sp.]|jgi:hypothetical protein|nr:hypothetical protein [Actinospica sp.]